MKVNANSIRLGNVIEHQNRLWRVAKKMHTMPGKGGAFVQLELKDVRDGTKLNERFRSSEDITVARLDQRDYQYLFSDSDTLTLMDTGSYEQITIPRDLLGEQAVFLKDGMMLTVESHEESPVSVRVPGQAVLEITEAEPVVKGQTAASSYKPALLENGIRVMVPPFIGVGEKIVVNTEDFSYVERAK